MGTDRGCGLRENRPGLNRLRLRLRLRLSAMVSDGGVTVVRVTCEDRPARFGLGCSRRLFAVHAVVLEVSHPKKSGRWDEPRQDSGSLVTTVAGRWYGLRSAQARERLLTETAQSTEAGAE